MAPKKSMIIMGIDPGLAHTGWGVVKLEGTHLLPVAYGCITTTTDVELPGRLAIIHDNLCEYIDRYQPVALSVEGIYFGANTKSAIATAQARGAALVACAYKGLQYGEYTPMQIKQALVGTGAADKHQVQYMVKVVLGLDHEPSPDHCADALAAAITHARLVGIRELQGKGMSKLQQLKNGCNEGKTGFERCVEAALAKEGVR